MLNRFCILLCILGAGLLAQPAPALAKDKEKQEPDLVLPIVTTALAEFYRVFERWPHNWAELRKEGFVQVDLKAPSGKVIDLDDKKTEFAGDMRYLGSSGPDSQARIFSTRINPVTGNGNTYLTPPMPYRMVFNGLQPGIAHNLPPWKDTARLKLLSFAALMRQGLANFRTVHNRIPKDWNELIHSGLCPLDENSLNPVSGKPFLGDGSPDDLLYEVKGDPTYGRQTWTLLATDSEGLRIPFQ